jgi:hypothetical protein
VINADEAERVRAIFEQYLALGCVSKLRENLEQRGIRSKRRILACGKFPQRLNAYLRNAAISRRFERDRIQYALETDWLAGAAGLEPLHLEIRSAELHPASTGFRRRSGAPLIRDAQVRVLPPRLRVSANSDSNMQRFESRRLNQPVRL